MKTKASLTAMKAERNSFALPAHIWLVFQSVYITKCHFLIKTAEMIAPCAVADADSDQQLKKMSLQ